MVSSSETLNKEVLENGFTNLEKGWKIDLYSGDILLASVPAHGTVEFFATSYRMSIRKSHQGHVMVTGLCDSFILMHENGMWVRGSVGNEAEDVAMRFPDAFLYKGNPVWIDTFTIWCGRG